MTDALAVGTAEKVQDGWTLVQSSHHCAKCINGQCTDFILAVYMAKLEMRYCYFFPPLPAAGRSANCCDERVCMFVCLSARVTHKPHVQTLWHFLSVLPVALAQSSSDDSAIRYVLPVLWLTICLPIIGQTRVRPIGHMRRVTHQWAEAGGELWCLRLSCCCSL